MLLPYRFTAFFKKERLLPAKAEALINVIHFAPTWRKVQTVKKPLESSRGPQPSRISIVPGGVYAGGGVIFESGNPISQSKNHFIAVFAPGNPKDFSENWRGWQWRGSLLPRPPACQNTILTSSAPGIAPGAFFRGGDSRNRLPRPDAWRGKPGVEKQLRRMCRLNSRNRRADRLYLGAQSDIIFSKTS